jgi:hypothetical protein
MANEILDAMRVASSKLLNLNTNTVSHSDCVQAFPTMYNYKLLRNLNYANFSRSITTPSK